MARSRTIEAANRLRFQRLVAAIIIGALLLVFITVGPLLFGGKEASPVAIAPVLTEIEAPKIDKNSDEYFEQQLAEGDINTLKIRLAQLQEESGLPVVLRLQNIARQIALGKRLFELDIDLETRDGVIEGLLLAINRRETLAIKHSMYSVGSVKQAEEFVSKPEVAGHPVHSDLAVATAALVATAKFLAERDTEKRIRQRVEALDLFNEVAWRDKNGVRAAEKLYELIGLIQDRGFATESESFVRGYLDAFSNSDLRRVNELRTELELVLSQTDGEFSKLFVLDPVKREQNVRDFSLQVQNQFAKRDVHPAIVATAIQKLEHLVRIGEIDEAEFLKTHLSTFVNRSADAIMKMAELDRMIRSAKTRFSPAGISKQDGRSVGVADLNKRTIMLFLSQTHQGETAHIIKTVGKSLGDRFRDKNLRFALVFIRDNETQSPPQDMQELAKRAELDIWFLNTKTASGRAFLISLPIDKTPYCVVLNNGDQIVALDPPAAIAGQVVFQEE